MCCTSMIAVLIGLDRTCLTLKQNVCLAEICPARDQDAKREVLLWPGNFLKSLVLGSETLQLLAQEFAQHIVLRRLNSFSSK